MGTMIEVPQENDEKSSEDDEISDGIEETLGTMSDKLNLGMEECTITDVMNVGTGKVEMMSSGMMVTPGVEKSGRLNSTSNGDMVVEGTASPEAKKMPRKRRANA